MLVCNLPSLTPHPSVEKLFTQMSSNNWFIPHPLKPQTCGGGLPLCLRDHLSGCSPSLSPPCKHFSFGSWQWEALSIDVDRGTMWWGQQEGTYVGASIFLLLLLRGRASGLVGTNHSHILRPHTLSPPSGHCHGSSGLWVPPPPVAHCVFLWQSYPLWKSLGSVFFRVGKWGVSGSGGGREVSLKSLVPSMCTLHQPWGSSCFFFFFNCFLWFSLIPFSSYLPFTS